MKDAIRHIAALLILSAATIGTAFGQTVMDRASFCRVNGRIESDSLHAKKAEWRDRVVSNFVRFMAGQKADEGLDYSDTYCNILTDDSCRVSIDMVIFSDKGCAERILRHIPENDFTEIDIPSEAPEKCLATHKDSTLIIVWCNLFADSGKICDAVNTFLKKERNQ